MPQRPYLTAPVPTRGMPKGIPFIIGNEAAERFSYYGMSAILPIFMTTYLRNSRGELATMTENDANGWFHLFVSIAYFFPIAGAFLSDGWWGKYRTIFWLSIVYTLGHAALAINDTRVGLAVGLGLIAIGAGGIKPCVSANVGDQFGQTNAHLISRAFSWFYFSINAGSFFSFLLIPWMLSHVGAHAAFGLPGVFMLAATVVFWSGRRRFVHIPPAKTRFLRAVFSPSGLDIIWRMVVIFAFVAVFWALWQQSTSEWFLQSSHMNLHVFGVTLLPAQLGSVNAILILAFIPLFQYLVYPAIERVFPLTELRKIGLGLVVIAAAFGVSAWIETQLAAGRHPSVLWQLPAYCLLSASEILVSITALEFAYTQAPNVMKSVISACFLLSVSAGNLFDSLFHLAIRNPDGTAKLTGAQYYLFFAGMALVAAAMFVFVAMWFRVRTHLQPEKPLAEQAAA